jgi:carbon-monoxide dehydrogenase small subunit
VKGSSGHIILNGVRRELHLDDEYKTLFHVLRENLGIKSVRRGCDYGGCGACTVIVDGKTICSCMYPALRSLGKEVLTLEGLSETELGRSLQDSFVRYHAYQCGYCTSGMIVSAYAFLSKRPRVLRPSDDDIREALAGNVCRCTGYMPIVKAVQAVADKTK